MTISALNKAALEAAHSSRIYFLFLDLLPDPFYACTGNRTYSFDGSDWLGMGEISGISELAEAADLAARQIVITASGVDPFIVEPVLSRTNYKGRQARIYRGLLNSNFDLIDDPILRWVGRMDVGSMVWSDSFVAQVTCEPLAARLIRPNISRMSDEDHQLRYAGDKFYEFLPQMEKKDVEWGGKNVSPGVTGSGGSGRGGMVPRLK